MAVGPVGGLITSEVFLQSEQFFCHLSSDCGPAAWLSLVLSPAPEATGEVRKEIVLVTLGVPATSLIEVYYEFLGHQGLLMR